MVADMPANSLDISQDYLIFDNTMTIVYMPYNGDGTYGSNLNITALKREDHKRLKPGNKKVQAQTHETIWEVATASMQPSKVIPKRGDKFMAPTNTPGGVTSTTFVVKDVDYCDFTTRYRLFCLQSGQGA